MFQTEHKVRVEWHEDGTMSADQPAALVAIVAAEHAEAFRRTAEGMGVEILGYRDEPVGYSRVNEQCQVRLAEVILQPMITYGASSMTVAAERRVHELAREEVGDWPGITTHVRPRRLREKGSGVRSAARRPLVVVGG